MLHNNFLRTDSSCVLSLANLHPNSIASVQQRCASTRIARAYTAWMASRLLGGWLKRPDTPTFHMVLQSQAQGLKRVRTSETELLKAWLRSGDRPYRTVTLIDNSELDIQSQYAAIAAADAFVLTHQAPVAWVMALPPPCAVVIEIGRQTQYEHMALQLGLNHYWINVPAGQNTKSFDDNMNQINAQVDNAETEWRKCMNL